MNAAGTLPCPGSKRAPACGNPIPNLPGTNTICTKCGGTVHIYLRPGALPKKEPN